MTCESKTGKLVNGGNKKDKLAITYFRVCPDPCTKGAELFLPNLSLQKLFSLQLQNFPKMYK